MRYNCLPSSSGAKTRAKEAFLRKWDKYKALEAILNTGNFDISLGGLDIGGDKEEGVSSEGQKSIISVDKPITAVEEQHHMDSTVDGCCNSVLQKLASNRCSLPAVI